MIAELPRIPIPRTTVNKCTKAGLKRLCDDKVALSEKAPPERGLPGIHEPPYLHRRLGTLVSQELAMKRLPVPDLSKKMSGLLRPKWLATIELFVGFVVPPKSGSTPTTTPPETAVGPEGTLPERWLTVTSMPLAPKSPIPIPENASLPEGPCSAGHFLVLFSTWLPFTSKLPTDPAKSAWKTTPAQLLWASFAAKAPRWAPATKIPNSLPERSLPRTFAFARCVPKKIPTTSLRRATLERIFVPGESSKTAMPSTELPMESFPAIVVFGLLLTSIPKTLLLTTLFTILVRELESTMMPFSVSGLPITWFFAIVVLTLLPKAIPLATLPVIRFPTTVALRAPKTSITNAVLSPFPLILKPRKVKPETLTSLTRGPVSLPVLMFTSPRTQIPSGPPVTFEQGESALA